MGRVETINNQQTQWEPLMTPADAAAYLRLHAKTVIRMARVRQIPAIRLGKHWRFRHSDLTAFAAEQVKSTCQPDE
jgi:excisionase family DNA binding protein